MLGLWLMRQDGSPAGFVMVVYEQAHLPRPEQSWGQVIYEQEAGSVLKKYDEVRVLTQEMYNDRADHHAASTRRYSRFLRRKAQRQERVIEL